MVYRELQALYKSSRAQLQTSKYLILSGLFSLFCSQREHMTRKVLANALLGTVMLLLASAGGEAKARHSAPVSYCTCLPLALSDFIGSELVTL